MRGIIGDSIAVALFGIIAILALAFVQRASGQQYNMGKAPSVYNMGKGESIAPPVKAAFPSFFDSNYFPVVVFVGTPPRSVPGITVCVEPLGFADSDRPCVIVFRTRKGGGERFPASMEDWQIIRAAGLEVTAQRPAFFQEPSSQQEAVAADDDAVDARVASLVPKGVRFFKLRPLYQNMYTMNNGNSRFADPTTIHDQQAPEHHPFIVSGGMQGLRGWKSAKGLLIPEGSKIEVWKELADVRAFSLVPRWRWKFPVGTVAVDALSTDKGVFEVRTQTRAEDGWETKVTFKDENARPAGYEGLQQSCASCHSHTGEIVDVPGRIYRRERWGSDGRFSFRPYREDGSLDRSWPLDVK